MNIRMSDAGVSNKISRNLIRSIKAKDNKGKILSEEGIIALKTAFSHPFFNEAYIYKNVETNINLVTAFFEKEPVRVALSYSHEFENHKKMLELNGFKFIENTLGMALQLSEQDEDIKYKKNVTFKEIDITKEFDLWLEPVLESFRITSFRNNASKYFIDSAGYGHFILLEDNNPVSAASLFYSERGAGIYFLCTNPLFRGKGMGDLLLKNLISFSRSKKNDYLTLHSSSEGRELYQKNGFDIYSKQAIFIKF